MVTPASRQRRPRFTIVIMILLSITVLTLDAKDVPVLGSIRSGVLRAVGPIGGAFKWATTPVRNAWNGMNNYDDLQAENRRLRARLDGLKGKELVNSTAVEDVKRLQAQLNIPFIGTIPTQVAQLSGGNFSSFDDNTARIDKGSSSGIQVGMPVVTTAGLIGRIQRVTADSATVRLITDPDLRIGIKLKSDDLGAGRGTGAGQKWLVDQNIGLADEVAKGDPVLTSGIDRALFPPGLPIGTVRSVNRDQADQIQILTVDLAADLTRLDYVQVLIWKPTA